ATGLVALVPAYSCHAPACKRRNSQDRSGPARALGLGDDAERVHSHRLRLAKKCSRASGGGLVQTGFGLSWTQLCIGGVAGRTAKLMRSKPLGEGSGEPGRTRTSNPLIKSSIQAFWTELLRVGFNDNTRLDGTNYLLSATASKPVVATISATVASTAP